MNLAHHNLDFFYSFVMTELGSCPGGNGLLCVGHWTHQRCGAEEDPEGLSGCVMCAVTWLARSPQDRLKPTRSCWRSDSRSPSCRDTQASQWASHTHTQPRHVRSLCAEDSLLPPAGPPRPARRHAQTLQPGCLRSAAADAGLRGRPLGLRSLGVPRAGPGHREGDNPGGRLWPGGGQAGCGRCVQGVSFLEAVHC